MKIDAVNDAHSYLHQIDMIKMGKIFLFMYKQDLAYKFLPDECKMSKNIQLVNELNEHVSPIWDTSSFGDFNGLLNLEIFSHFQESFGNSFHVADVGANYGTVSILMSIILKYLKYDRKIYSFEPGIASNLTRYNFELNKLDDTIEFFDCAAGQFNSLLPIIYNVGHSEDNRLLVSSPTSFSKITKVVRLDKFFGNTTPTSFSKITKVVRLDNLFENTALGIAPGYLKVDTQGYEPFVFDGLSAFFDKQIPLIIHSEFTPWALASPVFTNMDGAKGFLDRISRYFRIFHCSHSGDFYEITKDNHKKFANNIAHIEPFWTDLLCISHNFPDCEKLIENVKNI